MKYSIIKLCKEALSEFDFLKTAIYKLVAINLRLLQLLKLRQFYRIIQFNQNSFTNETKTLSTN